VGKLAILMDLLPTKPYWGHWK